MREVSTVLARAGEVSTGADPGTAAPPRTAPGRPPKLPRSGSPLLLPPWTRAPLLAFGEPAVILAVLAATAILACASASAALFLSSAATESLHRTSLANCRDSSYPALKYGPLTAIPPDRVEQVSLDGRFQPQNAPNVPDLAGLDRKAVAASTGAGLPAPYHVAVADRSIPTGFGGRAGGGLLFYSPAATANITALRRGPAHGVWLPAAQATRLSVRAGQSVTIGFNGAPTIQVPVAGIYQDLWRAPTTPYWCSYAQLFQNAASVDPPPAPFMIVTDPATFGRVQSATGLAALHTWASPIDPSVLTLSSATDLNARTLEAYHRLGAPVPPDYASANAAEGQLPTYTKTTELIRRGLYGPVVPIALGGSILALLLVGAAGSYWADRRYREVRLLSARGVGPLALAVKALLELAAPAIVGTVLGWLLARWLVHQLGPNPRVDPAAPGQALGTAAVALVAGLALLAVIAGLRSLAATERPVGTHRSRLGLVPWELLLLAAAGGCWLALRRGDAIVLNQGIAQINLLVVAFPLLFMVGAAVLLMRLLVLVLPRLLRPAGRRSAAWYLAGRRVSAARLASVTLLAAASTPIAVGIYAAGLTQTSQHTLQAKAKLVVGSSAVARTSDAVHRTPVTDQAGTLVTRYLYGRVGGADVTVLAIDPDTFAATAYWDDSFAARSLPDLLAAVRAPATGGRVPAVVVDGDLGTDFDASLGTSTAHLHSVGTARLWPGRRLPQPTVVVSAAGLGRVDPHAGTLNELWTTKSATDAEKALRAQGGRLFDSSDQSTVFSVANFLGISWTFGYLSALAALVGLVALGGLLLYLETRQRTRIASYALGRRMGLTRGAHLRSLLAELGTLLFAAYAVGAVLAWLAVLVIYRRLDVDSKRPPTPLLTAPTTAFLGTALAAAVVAVLAALYAQRSADRANPSEVLRLGG
jgi:putative ABC transport system permease protein